MKGGLKLSSKKKQLILLMLIIILLISGCSNNDDQQNENFSIVVKKLEVSPKTINIGQTAKLKIELNNKNNADYSYEWSLEDNTAAEITPQGKEAVYKAKKPGKYRVNVIVANSSGEEITLKQTVEVKRNFTADIPQTVLLTDNLIIKGTVTSKIEKVKVKVDGYYLTDQITGSQEIIPNDEDNYKLSYKFHQEGQERDLIVEAYNKEGQIVDEIKTQIDVVTDKITANYNDQIVLTDEFEITGQVFSKIDKIKVKVDGHYLTDRITEQQIIIPDKSGNYKLKYKFHEAGQNRNLIIEGYNNADQLIANFSRKIDVIKNRLQVKIKETVKIGEEFNITGKAYSPITKVAIKIDNYNLSSNIKVKNNNYSLKEIKLNTSGKKRNLIISGYDQKNNLVKQIKRKIDIVENNIVNSKEKYGYAVDSIIWKLPEKNGFFYTAEMSIDADGAPKAYHKDNNKALDYLANAGYSGNWWGIATDSNNIPYVQDINDPAPGYYVSTTALIDFNYHKSNPARYVNSSEIPFFVLPSGKSLGAQLGDYGVVYNKNNGKICYAIYADIGPTDHLGEGSIALAEKLGINSNAKYGGTYSDSIVYLVFPKSGIGQGTIVTKEQIKVETNKLFKDWGGIKQLKKVIN